MYSKVAEINRVDKSFTTVAAAATIIIAVVNNVHFPLLAAVCN